MRRFFLTVFLLGVFSQCIVFNALAIIDASLQMQLGNPSNASANTNNHDHYLIQRTVEAIDYSDNLGEAVWVSWDLTASDVGSASRSSSYFTDTNLPPDFYRVTDNDYNGVGAINFNRGHMCPSEDRTDTTADNDMVFFMSNIIPQDGTLNQGVWGSFEDYCRSLLTTDELLIICGPSGFGTNRIPSGKAAIAAYNWKIAVVVPLGSGTALSRITSSTRVIALKFPNTDAATGSWQSYVTSASQIEADTGFTFFSALPGDVATVLLNEVDGQTTNSTPPVIYSFSPTNGSVGDGVIITGTNFTDATAVTFDGTDTSYTVNSGTQITASVPANASTGFISVTTSGGTGISANTFTVSNTAATSYSGTLVGWDVSGLGSYGPSPFAPTTNAANLTIGGLTRGSGIALSGTAATNAWGGVNFTSTTEALAVAADKFATFSVMANAGYAVSFSSVSQFSYRHSGTGPTNGVVQYQVGNGAFTDAASFLYSSAASTGASIGPFDLTVFPDLQNVGAGTNVTFRIVSYLGTGTSGSWYIYNVGGTTAPDLALTGAVLPVSTGPTPLQSWRLLWFGATNNTGEAADTYVDTTDGMPNLLKYALGLNPTVATTNPVAWDTSTGYLRLTTARDTNATDVTLSGVVTGTITTGWTTNGTVVDQNGAVYQVHDATPIAGGTNRFIRLRVTSGD